MNPKPKFTAAPDNDEALTFRYGPVGQTEAIFAYYPRAQFPIGFIFYAQVLKNVTDVGYVWVHEAMRRRGVASLMLAKLREWYPINTIATAVGNELSTPWLEVNGFIETGSGWHLAPQIKPSPDNYNDGGGI